jgi:hypothetical protein
VPRKEDGGGLSADSLALVATAILGIASFLVQGHIAARAQKEASSRDRAQALRHDDEARVAKLLMRAQQQNAEFVYPVNMAVSMFWKALDHATFQCRCEEFLSAARVKWVSPPTQPYANLLNCGDAWSKENGALASNPFYFTLPPNDLARLSDDPARCARWVELIMHTALPPLRQLVPIMLTKVRTSSFSS